MTDFLNVPQRGTAEYDKWVKQQQLQLAKSTAEFAKANPTASPGVALAAASSGVSPKSSVASGMATTDASSKVNASRNAALQASASFKQMNGRGNGSPVDFLAPLTRTAFMALTTPYELLEATVRNIAGGKNPFENVLGQSSTGQAIHQLLTTGKVDVGTGFLDVDPNSAVGKALLRAKIQAGPKMSGSQPWTYQSGLTQALFDNPETKAARTFQAVSGFVFNLAFDPLTYVPGVGLVKIGKGGVSLRLGKAAEQAAAAKKVTQAGEDLSQLGKMREISTAAKGEASDVETLLASHANDVKVALADWRDGYNLVHRAKSEADVASAEYGVLEAERAAAFKDLKAAEQRSVALTTERRMQENVVARRAELGTAGRTADVEAILSSKGDAAVVATADGLRATEGTLPGMVHTAEEAALKKGGRTPTLGLFNGTEQVVRVAAAGKPKLLKLTQEVMPGTSAAAQRVGNALADALAPLGERANAVVETIVRDGATHADVVKAAQQSGILEDVYRAYQSIGIGGFSNVGTVRGLGGGTFAYFRPVVDTFSHDVSWWARNKQIPVLAPEVVDLGVQAPTVKGAITAQAAAMTATAAAPRISVYRDIAAIDSDLATAGERLNAAKQALSEATARKDAAVAVAKSAAARRTQEKDALDALHGIDKMALDYAAGLTHIDDAKVLDYAKFSEFIFGKMGANVANFVANHFQPTDYYELWNAFNRNISVDLAKSLAAATSEKEVLTLLAGEAGLDIGAQARAGLAARAISFTPGKVATNGATMRYVLAEKFFSNPRVASAAAALQESKVVKGADYFTRLMPTKHLMSLEDGDTLAREMYNAIPYLGGTTVMRDRWVKAMMDAETPSARFNVFMDSINDVVASQLGSLNDEQQRMLKEAARVFKREKEAHRNFMAQLGAESTPVKHMLANGQRVMFDEHDPLLGSQLAGLVKWPDVQEMKQITGVLGHVFSKSETAQMTRRAVDEVFNTRFKQLVLVGRVSYITRNIMDMQWRMYLNGSVTMFSHPLEFLSMMVGNPQGNAFQRQAAKMARFEHTVLGEDFRSLLTAEDDARFASSVADDSRKYGLLMARSNGFGVGQGSTKLPTGMKFLTAEDKNFNRAWAGAVLQYRADDAARLVAGGLTSGSVQNGRFVPYFKEARDFLDGKIAQGLDPVRDYPQIVTDFLLETKQGEAIRKLITDVNPEARAALMSTDMDVAREATMVYFETIAKGIDNLSAGSREIRDYIAGKRMVDVNGVEQVFDRGGNLTQDRWLGKLLADYRSKVDVSDAVGQLKLPGEFGAKPKGLIASFDEASGKFFRFSATLEKITSLGPEFRQQYWNASADQFALLSRSEAERVLAVAEKDLRRLKVAGVPTGVTHPALVKMRSIVKTLDDTGITAEDLHGIASGMASDGINKLFYDAMSQKQYAAASRIALPFAQAWANTLGVWGKLIAKDVTNTFKLQGQARAYKAANAFEFLNHPETGALYSWLNDNWNDSSQGFIFNDPTYGDKRIVLPLAGDMLGAMLSVTSGEKVPAMPVSLSVPSLNLAFSNELLPGAGPALQMTLGKLIEGQNTWIADQLQNFLNPYGDTSTGAQGVVERFTPAWAQRLLYGLHIDSYEQKNMSTLKPIMAYLATTGKYGDMPITAEQQNVLLEDAMKLNRVLALWRGITANVSPGSISPMILAKDTTGELHVQALMVNDFAQIRANNPDNYAAAVAKWANKYGDNALFSLVSGTRGGVTPTTDAWNFYLNNRDAADKFPNAFMLFFPSGEYSAEFAKWQSQRGQRFKLTPAEMQMEAARYVYSAKKARLQEQESVAVGQGEDPKDAHAAYLSQKAALDDEFGGQPDYRSAGVPVETLIKEVSGAIEDDRFASTEAGKGLSGFMQYRQAALDSVAQAGFKTLTGSKVANVATWLNDNAYRIIKQYPSFSVMYWRIFAQETGNN